MQAHFLWLHAIRKGVITEKNGGREFDPGPVPYFRGD